jgi:hypothetical protein
MSSKCSISCWVTNQIPLYIYIPFKPICVYKFIYVYIYTYMCAIPRPFSSALIDHPISPRRETTLRNLLVSSDFFQLETTRYFPQHPIHQYLQLCSSRNKKDRLLCSQKTQASFKLCILEQKKERRKILDQIIGDIP